MYYTPTSNIGDTHTHKKDQKWSLDRRNLSYRQEGKTSPIIYKQKMMSQNVVCFTLHNRSLKSSDVEVRQNDIYFKFYNINLLFLRIIGQILFCNRNDHL